MKTIAVLTMLFLPGIFVTVRIDFIKLPMFTDYFGPKIDITMRALFSAEILNVDDSSSIKPIKSIFTLWTAVSLPLTAVVLLSW